MTPSTPLGTVEGSDGIFVIRGGGNTRGWNGIEYKPGLSGKNVGVEQLSMNVATIPPGGVAGAHIHVGFEVMLYILRAGSATSTATALEHVVENQAGDFIFIEPGVPHEVFNSAPPTPLSPSSRDRRQRVGEHRDVPASSALSSPGGL